MCTILDQLVNNTKETLGGSNGQELQCAAPRLPDQHEYMVSLLLDLGEASFTVASRPWLVF